MGIYLAAWWKIFGKNLPASHFAMLPFLLGIVWQLHRLVKYFIEPTYFHLVLLLLLVDPTLLAQSTLVSPDIVLVFFFFWALNCILHKQRVKLAVALLFLSLISTRGMIQVGVLLVANVLCAVVLFRERLSTAKIINILPPFLPTIALMILWQLHLYLNVGWIGYAPASRMYQVTDWLGFVRNVVILGWRFVDFGRIVVWVIGIVVLWLTVRRRAITREGVFLALCFLATVALMSPLLFYTNPIGHRYYLPSYLLFALLVYHQLSRLKPALMRPLGMLTIVVLLTGNLLVYPEKIAQGWDASLAHLPYYQARAEMIEFIRARKLDISQIGTAFPNTWSFKYTDLVEDTTKFREKNLARDQYVLYSNVFNSFTDEEIDELQRWKVLHKIETITVKMILYQRP